MKQASHLARSASGGDMELARNFVAFAVDPSATTAVLLPFSPNLRLGLSRDLLVTVDSVTASDADAWVIDAQYFRAFYGPFSALDLIQDHARESGMDSVLRHGGAFQVSLGDHPHCASPAVAGPKGMGDLRRVSLQPSNKSIDSCLRWFTVDLFLDSEGQIVAVTLDVWEP